MEEDRIRRSLRVPPILDKAIFELAKNDHSGNYSNAAIRLLREGVESLKKKKLKAWNAGMG